MANILIDTELVEECLRCLGVPSRELETIGDILVLFDLLCVDARCCAKLVNRNVATDVMAMIGKFKENPSLIKTSL